MRFFVEFETEKEAAQFFAWKRSKDRDAEKEKAIKDFDLKNGATCISSLGWPSAITRCCFYAGVKTLEQAKALNKRDWMLSPNCGEQSWVKLQKLIELQDQK